MKYGLTRFPRGEFGVCVVDEVVGSHDGDGTSGNHQSLEHLWIEVLAVP